MELFQYDDCGDGDALIKSSVKHYKTNLRNDWSCHAQRQ